MTTTIENVRRTAAEYERLCREVGLLAEDDRVILSEGSRTYGRAYRVNTMRPGSSAHFAPPAGTHYLGMTKAEAWNTLAERCAVLRDVLDLRDREARDDCR